MINDYICENCGEKMIPINEESASGMTCPSCGWGFVTSKIDKKQSDHQLYKITLMAKEQPTKDNIRIIAKIMNSNFINAKAMIRDGGLLAEGLAIELHDAISLLNDSNIEFSVTPQYPYI